MAIPRGNPKIRPDHLDRPAFVYVRQSTLFQVLEHTASTARQYDLVQRAEELGWSRASITVIDQDQGLSGASAVDREGFQFLIAQVGLGKAGAVLSLEASRLARSCTDWYRLLEICAPYRHPGHRRGWRLRPQPIRRPFAARHPGCHERGRTPLAP